MSAKWSTNLKLSGFTNRITQLTDALDALAKKVPETYLDSTMLKDLERTLKREALNLKNGPK